MRFNFNFGRRDITVKQWVVYSVATVALAATISYWGTRALQSRHGDWIRSAICSTALKLPDGYWSRFFHSLCEASEDKKLTEDEAKGILDKTSRASRRFTDYFDRDPDNYPRRASSEVSYAIDRWKLANPSPRIDQTLRRSNPNLSDTQLCVLSQAERYTDGDAIGIRYVGMEVCEDD